MLLLFETPAGFSLFKVKDEGKLEDVEVSLRSYSSRASKLHVFSRRNFNYFALECGGGGGRWCA